MTYNAETLTHWLDQNSRAKCGSTMGRMSEHPGNVKCTLCRALMTPEQREEKPNFPFGDFTDIFG